MVRPSFQPMFQLLGTWLGLTDSFALMKSKRVDASVATLGLVNRRTTFIVAQRHLLFWFALKRMALAIALSIATVFALNAAPAFAATERSLYLYYTHTQETARIVFKRNGRYDSRGLAKLNQFLRDWRRNESIKMDPALFDLIWEVYKESGATKPVYVVSAYRSPATNEMLRSRSKAVAKNSRHTQGMALDFYIPGVSLNKLRELAMRKQIGGVGYYPASGSPFVHLDTGNVRAWPRMTRAQLRRVFPDGRTLHLPTDGVPLSGNGRAYAQAQWTRCHRVPCSTSSSRSGTIVASTGDSTESGRRGNLMDLFFGGESSSSDTPATTTAARPAQRQVASIPVTAPTPMSRPAALGAPTVATAALAEPTLGTQSPDTPEPIVVAQIAPVPAIRPEGLRAPETDTVFVAPIAVAAATSAGDASAAIPAPRVLLTAARTASAYAPTLAPEPNAQRALQMLIEQRNATLAAAPNLNTMPSPPVVPSLSRLDEIHTASLGTGVDLADLADLIDKTWSQISAARQIRPAAPALNLQGRTANLVAPDLEHIIEVFVDSRAVSSARFAVLFEPDEADFDPAVELGTLGTEMGFGPTANVRLSPSAFSFIAPLSVAQL